MRNTGYLTEGHDPALARLIQWSWPGMAHWAASGPSSTTCGQCSYFGYWQQIHNASGDIISTKYRKDCCGRYHSLTGRHGPAVPASAASCRHFKPIEK
jgi:hypothetical protein